MLLLFRFNFILSYYIRMPTPSYTANTCDCSYGQIMFHPAQCRGCTSAYGSTPSDPEITAAVVQKRIWGQVRAPASMFSMNLAALTVAGDYKNAPKTNLSQGYYGVNWNQMSDRNVAHIQLSRNVPSRGNSTRTTLTRHQPGAAAPGGAGVDVKHGSYARYLARKKAGNIRTQKVPTNVNPVRGNKTRMIGMVACPPTREGQIPQTAVNFTAPCPPGSNPF